MPITEEDVNLADSIAYGFFKQMQVSEIRPEIVYVAATRIAAMMAKDIPEEPAVAAFRAEHRDQRAAFGKDEKIKTEKS